MIFPLLFFLFNVGRAARNVRKERQGDERKEMKRKRNERMKRKEKVKEIIRTSSGVRLGKTTDFLIVISFSVKWTPPALGIVERWLLIAPRQTAFLLG